MDLHDIARQVASTAGADFAFVLSQAGLLVTHDAPRDMPDSGRTRILWACPSGKNGEIAHLEMPREELVPFGGAAPIDVFAIRVEDTAILVAAMASWNDKSNVVLALTSGAAGLGEMIRKAKRARAQKNAALKSAAKKPGEARRERTSSLPKAMKEAPAAKKSSGRAETLRPDVVRAEARGTGARPRRTDAPPAPTLGAIAGGTTRPRRTDVPPAPTLGALANGGKARRTDVPPAPGSSPGKRRPEARGRVSSEPEIEIGEATVGRETLYAIEAPLPRMLRPHAKAGPSPEGMRVQLDSIGRETLLDIETIEAAEKLRRPTVDEPLVLNERRTLPWVDTAGALKRSIDAKAKARGMAAPDVKVEIEEMDPDALERALREDDAG